MSRRGARTEQRTVRRVGFVLDAANAARLREQRDFGEAQSVGPAA